MRMRIVAAGVALVCVGATAYADAPPSSVVFPTQSLPMSFSHTQHLKLGDVGCGTCHEDAATSLRAADDLLPKESSCTACHEIDRQEPEKHATPPARCDSCHMGAGTDAAGESIARLVVPPPNLRFNHKLHMDAKMRCVDCHKVTGVGLATRAELPKMSSCLTCHDGKKAPAACTTCHPAGASGRLETSFDSGSLMPSGTLRGDAHDLRFRIEHARVAQNDGAYCANCHSRSYCQDCHAGRVKPFDFHSGDYVAMHAIDARRRTTDCSACHRQQTFCVGCHARSGVNADPKTSEFQRPSQFPSSGPAALRRFHPDGYWTTNLPDQRASTHHSFDAQRNINTCASCHREAFCMDCHTTGQISPHPIGWKGSSRCKALASRAGRTCLRCHATPDVPQQCQ